MNFIYVGACAKDALVQKLIVAKF